MSNGDTPAEERVKRVLFGDLRPGETPIDDFEGLLVPEITFLHQLSDHESENIADAFVDYFAALPKKSVSFDAEGAKSLHRDMFCRTWTWAGQFRLRDINNIQFTSPFHHIQMHVSDLFENLKTWKNSMVDPLEISALLHHRAVQIHPFVNGNGRWARMLTNVWLTENLGVYIRWPEVMVQVSPIRGEYVRSLQEADRGDLGSLISMHKQYVARFDNLDTSAN